ncbi:MAG: TetR/AcrR family transcriptional regulator [Acidobacteria bacterium]|nr:TetR/AcrR family transcriptional regulator [Acidobacteriota bacterium]
MQLFSRQGFSGTGTREIAQLADVHETTLFRYYRTKKELFWAALESRLERIRLSRDLQSALSGDDHPGMTLPRIFEFLVHVISEQPELVRLLSVSALELPGSDDVYRIHLGAIFDSVSAYLKRCAAKGAIRDVDPHIVTLALVGTVLAHWNMYQIFVDRELPFATPGAATLGYSNFWLNILQNGNSVPMREDGAASLQEPVISADSEIAPSEL